MVEYNMKEKLLKEIFNSGEFTENNIFHFCIDNGYDIATVTNTINNLIDSEEIVKCYYHPYECRFSDEPMGDESYMILTTKLSKFLNIEELMKGL